VVVLAIYDRSIIPSLAGMIASFMSSYLPLCMQNLLLVCMCSKSTSFFSLSCLLTHSLYDIPFAAQSFAMKLIMLCMQGAAQRNAE